MTTQTTRNADGVRTRHIAGNENRALPYSDWHRSRVGRGCYALDSDLIEWRFRGSGKSRRLVPVAITELTRVDIGVTVNKRLLDIILERFNSNTRLQGMATRYLAEALKTKAWVVLFREDCSEFWVYNLSDGGEWTHKTEAEMLAFLRRL